MIIVDTLLRLEYGKEIGQEGKNSTVHIAFDPQLNANLVIKRIEKSEFTNEECFFSEAQMLYATQHPNIMPIKYATQDEHCIYISMDYYKKGSLNALIESKFLTVKEIIKYSLEFLSGIHYMHTKNLVHFDVKPTNILISDSDKAVITDFGLAKYLNTNGFATADKLYPFHIPPEAFEIGKLSTYTDIYQAGLTLYRMCNGNHWFKNQLDDLNITSITGLASAIAENKFPKKNAFLPHIPDKLRKVISKSLTNDVTKRYETILDMLNDISGIEEHCNWVYNEYENKCSSWMMENETHRLELKLEYYEDGWRTTGYKTNLTNGKSNRVNKWFTSGYKDINEAHTSIKKLLK